MKAKDYFKIIIKIISPLLLVYIGFYLKGILDTRARIADTLAEFYSSAAAEYYANFELQTAKNEAPIRIPALYTIYDQDYKNFLSASTKLSAMLPENLQIEVLDVENVWDNLSDNPSSTSEKIWFETLDKIRDDILRGTVDYKFLNPLFFNIH